MRAFLYQPVTESEEPIEEMLSAKDMGAAAKLFSEGYNMLFTGLQRTAAGSGVMSRRASTARGRSAAGKLHNASEKLYRKVEKLSKEVTAVHRASADAAFEGAFHESEQLDEARDDDDGMEAAFAKFQSALRKRVERLNTAAGRNPDIHDLRHWARQGNDAVRMMVELHRLLVSTPTVKRAQTVLVKRKLIDKGRDITKWPTKR